jgi:DMSO/TMAO reductase YedYZ molybdopterin-dependent catalytic subunit
VKGRWANLALVVLVPAAALSGVALFLVGSGPVWLVAALHAGLGLGPLALVPWKRPVVQRGLRRLRPGRTESLVLGWVLLAALLSGLLHLAGLTAQTFAVTTMQIHVTAGALAAALTVVHAVQRPVRLRRPDWGRRALLRTGGVVAVSAGLGVTALLTGDALARAGERRSTGSFRVDDDQVPVTQWFLDTVPAVEQQAWHLALVSPLGEQQLTVADLTGRDEVTAALDCTGGWWTEVPWAGTRLTRLLPGVDRGLSVVVTSSTGYARRLPLTDDLLLATSMAGSPLTVGHGAPVRLVVPGRRGYHWVKWVERVDLVAGPWWVEPPLPLR